MSTLVAGGTAILRATGTYSDGSMVDLTSSVVWASTAVHGGVGVERRRDGRHGDRAGRGRRRPSPPPRATIMRPGHRDGVGGALVRIIVNPAAASTPVGTTVTADRVGLLLRQHQPRHHEPGRVDQRAGKPSPRCRMPPGSAGVVTGVTVGTATVTATLNGVAGSATVTVVAATLQIDHRHPRQRDDDGAVAFQLHRHRNLLDRDHRRSHDRRHLGDRECRHRRHQQRRRGGRAAGRAHQRDDDGDGDAGRDHRHDQRHRDRARAGRAGDRADRADGPPGHPHPALHRDRDLQRRHAA